MEKRRTFIKKLSGLTAGIMVPVSHFSFGKNINSDKWGTVLPKRKLGKTGVEVTMLGVGGYHYVFIQFVYSQQVFLFYYFCDSADCCFIT